MNKNLKSALRRYIRSSPFLYKNWIRIRVGNTSSFPTKYDDLHLTGYQRSGNTFAMRLLRKTFPKAKISTHLHSVSSIKMAISFGVPVIVLIREPEQAIASSILKRVDSKGFNLELAAKYDIDEYFHFYSFVKENLNALTLVGFEFLTSEPVKFIEEISSVISNLEARKDCYRNIVEEVMDSLKNDLRDDGDRNFKSEYKEAKKKEIFEVIRNNETFIRCVKLNEELREALPLK